MPEMSSTSTDQSPYPSASMSSPQQGGTSSSSMTTSSIPTTTSSRRGKPPPPKGMALGLEEEVDFGSDEDLMENVGEIALPTQGWYPGKPDSPPRSRKDKGKKSLPPSSSTSTNDNKGSSFFSDSSKKGGRSSLLGKKKSDKSKGLNDAKVILAPEMAGSVGDLLGHSRQASDPASSTSGSALTGRASQTSLKKDKKSGMFGRMFGGKAKKEDEKLDVGIRSRENVSVSSFGSYARSEASSQQRSILITPAHMPPTHLPGRSEPSIAGLPSVNTSPFSYDLNHSLPHSRSRSGLGHEQQGSFSTTANIPLISAGAKPGTISSEDRSESRETSGPGSIDSPSLNTPNDLSFAETGSEASFGKAAKDALRFSTGSSIQRPSIVSMTSSQLPAVVESTDLVHFLIPSFPTSSSNLESTTILSTTVMRRLPLGSAFSAGGTPDSKRKGLRPNTGASLSSFGSTKLKPIWQTHQLVLTSFRLNEPTPHSSPNPQFDSEQKEVHERRPSTTQTIAHLHLFSLSAPSKGSKFRGSGGTFGEASQVEVERSRIGPETSAGVWEGTDSGEGGSEVDKGGRKFVLRVRFDARDVEEWLCDMPSAEALFEWIKQIKGYATVIRAETLGYGSALRQAHASGSDRDLALELEMHTKGLRSTPSLSRFSKLQPTTPIPLIDPFVASPASTEPGSRLASPAQNWIFPTTQLKIDEVDPLDRGVGSLAISSTDNFQGEGAFPERRGSTSQADENRGLHATARPGSISRTQRFNLPPRPPIPSGLPPPVPPPVGELPPVPPQPAISPSITSSPFAAEPSPTLGHSATVDNAASPNSSSLHQPQPRPVFAAQISDDLRPQYTNEWRGTLSNGYKPLSLAPEMSASPTLSQHSSPHQSTQTSTGVSPNAPPMGLAISGSTLGPETPTDGGFYTPSEDIAGISGLKARDSRELLRPSTTRTESDRIETASIASSAGGSSLGRRRNRLKVPAVDLMAELNARPEMNFGQTVAQDDTPIDESRPRRIRFAG